MLQMRNLEVQQGDMACPRSHIFKSVPSKSVFLMVQTYAVQYRNWTESHLQCVTFKFLIQNETKASPLVTLAIFQKYNSHMWIAAPERGVTESSSAGPIESLTDPRLESTGRHSDPGVEPESGLWVRRRKEKGAGRTSSESGGCAGHGAEGLTSAGSFTRPSNSTPVPFINPK